MLYLCIVKQLSPAHITVKCCIMTKTFLFTSLQKAVDELNEFSNDSRLVHDELHKTFSIVINKPCLFLSDVSMHYITAVGFPFSLDVLGDEISFTFSYNHFV